MDYRNTEYCDTLDNIKDRKQEFKMNIDKDHPKLKNYYHYISDKDGPYKLGFLKIFNEKCAYCGNSLDNISIDLFEIDHFINEASILNKEIGNHINNLVPACQNCNRGKSGITIHDKYVNLLNPECKEISDVFYRDEKYYIRIKEEYISDKFINKFYDALKFGNETKRLDFLLLKMRGLYKTIEEDVPLKNGLLRIINDLQQKRNKCY